jgi:CrcB protein
VSRLLVIAIGGVIGSLGRYGIALATASWGESGWPWETLIVNVVGSLAIGIVATVLAQRTAPEWVRPFVITGILGGFTTFSAFALQTGLLLDHGRALMALSYVLATLVLGLLAVRVGIALARGRSA